MKNINIDSLKEIALKRGTARTYFAIGLLLFSFFAALAITGKANQSVTVWAAGSEIAAGDPINSANTNPVKVFLPDSINKYLSSKTPIQKGVSNRRIAKGELIPRSALALSFNGESVKSVPLRIARNDLPSDLLAGQIVDVYYLPKGDLICEGVSVESIDQKSKDMGGEIGIVLKIPEFDVVNLLSALKDSRIVVVRSAI